MTPWIDERHCGHRPIVQHPADGRHAPDAAVADPHADATAVVFETTDLAVYYGEFRAVRDVNLTIQQHEITAFIGPSGCGKSTVLRCFDRMNDLIEIARVEGKVRYHGLDLYGPDVDAVEVRRRIGMVFQKPNPFPKSIYDNLVFGPRLNGIKKKSELDDIVESSLASGGLVGRGQGPPEGIGDGSVGRSAATPLHRPLRRGRAGGDPDGRAVLGARPDRDGAHRGADAGDQERLHDHHRDPQHAAGRPCERPHCVLHHRGHRRKATGAPVCSSSSTATAKMFSNPTTSGPRPT